MKKHGRVNYNSISLLFPTQALKYDTPFHDILATTFVCSFLASESFLKGNMLPGILYYSKFPGRKMRQMKWHLKIPGIMFLKTRQ